MSVGTSTDFALDERIASEIIEYGRRISAEGLTKGTWGNLSVRTGNFVYITPSGKPYDTLETHDICVLNLDGTPVHAPIRPSSEYLMHLQIYSHRTDVNAILHTHPVYSTVVSVTVDYLPPIVEDSVMILGENLRVTEYALPGTTELALEVVRALGGNHCVFLRNHGLVTVGATLHEAYVATLVAEKTAQIFVEALRLGKIHEIPKEHAKSLREKYLKDYRQLGKWGA